MRRRLLTLLTVLSLVLCVATVVLWVRSYSVADEVRYSFGPSDPLGWKHHLRWIEGCAGYVRLWKFDEVYRFNDPSRPFTPMGVEVVASRKSEPVEWHRSHPKAQEQFFGATLWRQETRFPERHISAWYVSIPCPMLLAALMILPISRLGFRLNGAYRRAARRRSGGCPRCGYDLRATPGRCPECGAAATTPA